MNRNQPPRWVTTLLSWWADPNTLEEVEGDLLELYAYWVQTVGVRKANWRYALSALKLVRPLAKRETHYPTTYIYSPTMIQNYFKIAFRNLLKYKGYSFINIFGLATGMAVAILIGLWVWDELSFNKYHKNYEHIAQIVQQRTVNGEIKTNLGVPIPLGKELRTSYPNDFKQVLMSSWTNKHILTFGDAKYTKTGNFMSPETPQVLSLKMRQGTWAGLKEQSSILLSESTAKALFGKDNPMDKLIKIDNELNVKVTGVYEDLPYNTDFKELNFIAPWELYVASTEWVKEAQDLSEWGQNSFQIFVEIAQNAQYKAVSEKIKNIKLTKGDKNELKFMPKIILHPMSRWHLYSEWENGVNTGGRVQFVWLFGIIGAFVLLLACINFMNLSTARSEKRAKEVGIRKAIGSVRSQLIGQFYSESFLVVAIAFVFSLLLVILILPLFNQVADKQMTILWSNPAFWVFGIGFVVLTSLVAGSYPAIFLSSFQPIKALKWVGCSSRIGWGRLSAMPRKVLVVLQFTVSVTLIIGTLVVYRQIIHAKNRPIGYTREGLVTVYASTADIHEHLEAFRNDLVETGTVLSVAESQSPATDIWSNNTGFTWKGKDPGLQADFATIGISHAFGATVGWKFVDGRDFSKAFASDSAGFVLNETAAKFIGLKNPVGEIIKWGDRDFKVIGIVKDMIMTSPYEPVKQSIFYIRKRAMNFITIRVNPASTTPKALKNIETVFKHYSPASPFEYTFVDQEYGLKFAAEERIGQLASFFAILTIFISCLGLFGLASFVAEQRTKEIGIRKVLGASVANLWQLLSKDFIVLVLISCCIAAPIAYYFMNEWIQKYKYRTDISWWIFVAVGSGALTITLLTVSFQAIKAALMNPVKSLKSE